MPKSFIFCILEHRISQFKFFYIIREILRIVQNLITSNLGLLIFNSQLRFSIVQQDHLTVKSELSLLNHVQEWFEQFCLQHLSQLGWSKTQLDRLNLALAEGFTNAVRHAHHALPPETTIEINIYLWIDRLEIRIWDYGKPFDPDAIAEPVPGTLQVGGYGWFLLRRLADRVVYERGADGRNCLLIVKYSVEAQQ
ncbi:MAG: anti-sigma regulatory factor [Nostoc sp. C3-bin3]|nr:anti-sigma regulatory factor [Nostoc sp. C3-bin3]